MLFQLFQQYQTGGQRLSGVFQYLIDYGFQDFMLPALLIFVVIYAILQQVALFRRPKMKAIKDAQGKVTGWEPVKDANGKTVMTGDRKINSILAIAISLMITIPHVIGWYPPDRDPIYMISSFLPSTAIVLVAIFAMLLLLGLAGTGMPNMVMLTIALIAAGFLIVVFLMNVFPYWLPTWAFLRDPAIQALIIILLVMGLVGWWVIRPESTPAPGEESWFKKWMTTRR